MLNVIRMEIYRMFHTCSFYVTILLGVAMACTILFSMSKLNNSFYDQSSGIYLVTDEQGVETEIGADEYAEKEAYLKEKNYNIKRLTNGEVATVSPGNVCGECISAANMFVGIFAALFVGRFYNNGFCKNVMSRVRHKYYFQISRFFCVMIYSAVILLLNTISTVGLASIIIHYFEFINFGQFAMFLLGKYLLLCSIGMFCTFVTDTFRSNIPAIVYSVLLSTNLITAIVWRVNARISDMLSIDFDVRDYLPSIHDLYYQYDSYMPTMSKILIHAAVLSICAFVVYNVLGSIQLTKRDF